MPATVKALTALALAALPLAACAQASAPARSPEPQIGPLVDVSGLSDFSLPLDSYRYLPWQDVATDEALNLLIARCLDRFGLEPPDGKRPSSQRTIGFERRYSLVKESEASRYGWHLPTQDNQTATASQPPLSPDVKAVMSGLGQASFHGLSIPEGGCAGEARRTIGPEVDQNHLADQLSAQSLTMVQRDSRVEAVTTKWSNCMKTAGYDYRHPEDAVADPKVQGDAVTKEEIGVATASVRCAAESNLLAISVTVDAAYQNRLIDQNAVALAAIKESRENERRKAAEILAGG